MERRSAYGRSFFFVVSKKLEPLGSIMTSTLEEFTSSMRGNYTLVFPVGSPTGFSVCSL